MQLATSGQPGSQSGGNEADSDEGEDDGDGSEIDTTAMELIVSCVYENHLADSAASVDLTGEFCGVTSVLR